MKKVQVRHPGGSYPVHIGAGAIAALDRVLRARPQASRLFLISDRRAHGFHGEVVEARLEASGIPWERLVLPAGEKTKSIEQLGRIWRRLAARGLDRQSLCLALGGGVIGDLTGFAAASFLRGVDFLQLPTTLLAMVDASVGGKTGINLPEGKNLVGAFHQPRAVVMDTDFLRTLPDRELAAGWAEVLKTAAIRDRALARKLTRLGRKTIESDPEELRRVIARCVRIKADVVEEDEREGGLRRILNFGHTLAHAIEAEHGYGKLLHGEAVALGMVFAARLGETIGATREGVAGELRAQIESYGLPVCPQRASLRPDQASRMLAAMHRDKKRGPRGIRWVFLEDWGATVEVDGLSDRAVKRELVSFLKSTES